MYKAVLGLHYKRKEQKKSGQLAIFYIPMNIGYARVSTDESSCIDSQAQKAPMPRLALGLSSARLAPRSPLAPLHCTATSVRVGTACVDALANSRDFNDPKPESEKAIAGRNGILKLTLHANAYEWELMTVDGESPDKGSQSCR